MKVWMEVWGCCPATDSEWPPPLVYKHSIPPYTVTSYVLRTRGSLRYLKKLPVRGGRVQHRVHTTRPRRQQVPSSLTSRDTFLFGARVTASWQVTKGGLGAEVQLTSETDRQLLTLEEVVVFVLSVGHSSASPASLRGWTRRVEPTCGVFSTRRYFATRRLRRWVSLGRKSHSDDSEAEGTMSK